MSDVLERVDLEILEEIFNAPHCDHPHGTATWPECSHQPVAALVRRCGKVPVWRVCGNVAKAVQRLSAAGSPEHCGYCNQRCSHCWHLEPL